MSAKTAEDLYSRVRKYGKLSALSDNLSRGTELEHQQIIYRCYNNTT